MLESSTASHYTCPTPLMMAPSSATSKAPSATGVYCSGIPHLTSPQYFLMGGDTLDTDLVLCDT